MRVMILSYFNIIDICLIGENIERVSIEYFDEMRLRQFAKSSTSLEKGILQKFINPREEKNRKLVW
jgi:hypothetical protein